MQTPHEQWLLETRSPSMQQALHQLNLALRADLSVLLTGETGVGKGVLARLLHSRIEGRKGQFVTVDGTVLSRDQTEAELFGIAPKFATGVEAKMGLVHAARGGTLFFDEVADLLLDLQGKILRLIDERCFRRVGAVESESTDARFVFATLRDVPTMVREGTFRRDLYYRMRQVAIHIPALRERPEDVLPLARHLCKVKSDESRHVGISSSLERLFQSYRWPGNVRELVNCIENLLIQERVGDELTPELLPDDLRRAMSADVVSAHSTSISGSRSPSSTNPQFPRVPRKAFVDFLLGTHMPHRRATTLLQTFRGGGRTVARQLAQVAERPVLWLVDTANEQSVPSLFFERLTRDSGISDLLAFDRWLRRQAKENPDLLIIQTEPRGPDALLEDTASVVRSLLEEYSKLHFLIMGGERLLRMRRHENYSWRNLLHPSSLIDVPDLNVEEIARQLANCGLASNAAERLRRHTGGHPWLLFELISKGITTELEILRELREQIDQSGLLDRHCKDPETIAVLQRLVRGEAVESLFTPSIRRNPRYPESRLFYDTLLIAAPNGETSFRCQAVMEMFWATCKLI